MFDFFHRSLRNKLLIAFIVIGFSPYLLFLVYTLFLSENKILNKTVLEQYDRANMIIHVMQTHLHLLEKEVLFLSRLDLMDDLIAEDIDKRISRLLTQKYHDYNLDLTLMALDTNNTVIAASSANLLLKQFDLHVNFDPAKEHVIINDTLYIYTPITASFDANKTIGTLLLTYNLHNLDTYLIHQQDRHAYIINPHSNITVGDRRHFHIALTKEHESLIAEEHLIVYTRLKGMLHEWYLVYGVDKHIALAFLYDFIRFMLYLSPFIFAIIIYVAVRYSKHVVKPIQQLTAITDTIIETKNYSAQLQLSTQDETARLSNSFNKMIRTTHDALQHLERENRIRLQRFIQLIDVFNTIIQTKNETDCIEVSLAYLKELTHKKELFFSTEIAACSSCIDLYVNDFEKNEKLYYGYISLNLDSFDDTNEKEFYRSIATMIMLQLDRIRLINRTLLASRAKSAFISHMSHELRTPLNAIIGFAQYLITYEELNDDQQDSIANIESSAQYLLGMINEILDIAKIEAGKMEVHKERLNIVDLVHNSCAMLQPLADDKELVMHFDTNSLEPFTCITDPKLFQQITLNLLSNAIKFTDNGGITLTLSKQNQTLVLSIVDTGIGIDPLELSGLFHDFTQAGDVMQKGQKGSGLGLSLSKKMAHLLHGDVTLESDGIGTGCRATLFIKI